MLANSIFYILATLILVSGLMTVLSANPIYSALYLAITMISLAGMFYTLDAHFIAGVQLIVYAGAVMVLFVMVLMLFDLKTELRAFSKGAISNFLKLLSVALLAGLVVGAIPLSTELLANPDSAAKVTSASSTKDLAMLLFTKYVFAFEALGLLLLVVAVGVVAVSRIKGGTHARH